MPSSSAINRSFAATENKGMVIGADGAHTESNAPSMFNFPSGLIVDASQRVKISAFIIQFLACSRIFPTIAACTAVLGEIINPIKFIYKGTVVYGYPAETLTAICKALVNAQVEFTTSLQLRMVKRAAVLLSAFAEVGLVALIDEATGYQYERAKKALAEILEKFISKELRAWTKTFPTEFYQQIFRLKGWRFDPSSVKRPVIIGLYTNDVIYKRLAPGVLKELRSKNPVVDGRRKHKMFQWLTGDVGHPKLRSHIDGVLALMRISDDWKQFKQFLKKAYPAYETTELGLEIQLKDKD